MADIYSLSAAASTKEQFLELISSSTLKRIKFPELFYKDYVERNHRDEFVTLISPLSSKEWKVRRIGCKLKEGWIEFVIAHRLRVGDHVRFTHEGNFVFTVTTFAPSGCRYHYVKIMNETNQVSNEAGSLLVQKRKTEQENSSRAKVKAGVVIKDAGNLSLRTKEIKNDKNISSVETDSFIQTVAHANLKNNSVYIPKKFANENKLIDKNLDTLALVNSDKDMWGVKVSLCTDNRFKIIGGWEALCEANNLQIGDCCKFKIRQWIEHIVLDLVGVSTNEKKAAGVTMRSIPTVACKEEQCELEEGPSQGC